MSAQLPYHPVRTLPLLEIDGVQLLVRREDQNHPYVSGNKWWKLKYNLAQAKEAGHHTVLTFGGAYSNHIYATAAAAQEVGLKSIAIIRGERVEPLNNTLAFAEEKGMKLVFASRESYRQKETPEFIADLKNTWGEFYLIPEGGTNEWALMGCAEWAQLILKDSTFDYLCLPVGTGGTISGLVRGLNEKPQVLGYAVLKGATFLEEDIRQRTDGLSNWKLYTDYHFGGYGKVTPELISFIQEVESNHALPLDPVYTAKALFGVMDQIKNGFFPVGSTVLFVHTGGLQGRAGFNF